MNEGDRVDVTDEGVTVQGADAVTLTLAGATNHNNFRDVSADPAARCAETIQAVRCKDYGTLRQAHVDDHRDIAIEAFET